MLPRDTDIPAHILEFLIDENNQETSKAFGFDYHGQSSMPIVAFDIKRCVDRSDHFLIAMVKINLGSQTPYLQTTDDFLSVLGIHHKNMPLYDPHYIGPMDGYEMGDLLILIQAQAELLYKSDRVDTLREKFCASALEDKTLGAPMPRSEKKTGRPATASPRASNPKIVDLLFE